MPKFQSVLRSDPTCKLFRVCRLIWNVGSVGDGNGFSNKFSFALSKKLFGWKKEYSGWILTVAGMRFHYCRSHGGIFA